MRGRGRSICRPPGGVYGGNQVSREAWSARHSQPRIVYRERAMSTQNDPVDISPSMSAATSAGSIRYLTRDRIAILAALAAPLAAAAILLPFRASWSNTNVALLLVVTVVGVAAIGNRIAGGLAAVWAAAWFDFFFTLPYYRFTIRSSADVTTAVLLLLTGLAVSQLAARARRLQVIAITDEGYLAQIHETASLAKSATFPDAVVDH